ncbi:MAG: 1-acyl-sn-glycerol-3-phosphate acyltransferase, partial [Bacteroidota bacterium]
HFPRDIKKYIVVVAPHTSYWDFPLGLLSRSVLRRNIGFIAKSELFKFPLGPIMKWWGGVPVDRSKNNNFVEAVAELFESKEELAICITPEGTRRKVSRLRSGFFHMAKAANVPLNLCTFDFKTKTITFDKPYYVTGDKDETLEYVWNYFKGVEGKHKEQGIF